MNRPAHITSIPTRNPHVCIIHGMGSYEIVAAGDRNGAFDRWVEALQQAGISAKQMLIADFDREKGFNPHPHPRGTEVYVLVPTEKLDEALATIKRIIG